jgi:hypothetical protein
MKMEWHVCLTMALLAVAHNGRAQFPGTPTTNWINPGTQTLIIGESVDTGIQPIDVAGAGTSFSNTIRAMLSCSLIPMAGQILPIGRRW